MASLTIALLGLNRTSCSVGLALKRYMKKGGKHSFEVVGYDSVSDHMKQAKKLEAIDRSEQNADAAVKDADLVVMSVSYEETEHTYKNIQGELRDGVVILDMSPLKQPSLAWSDSHLSADHHLVGMTPIFNPHYLFATKETVEEAEEDLFDNSAILLTPAASSAKEAVDLAFNFAVILGSKPRFLDPLEHDMLLAQTVQLPKLLGTVLFYELASKQNWEDLKWFTNPDFGALTRPLFDTHPDALRDELYQNRDVLARVLDEYIATLSSFRDILREDDEQTLETAIVSAAEDYEQWINSRYKADWDSAARGPETKSTGMLQGLIGGKLADRIFGNGKDD